jgi:hypothetical protein
MRLFPYMCDKTPSRNPPLVHSAFRPALIRTFKALYLRNGAAWRAVMGTPAAPNCAYNTMEWSNSHAGPYSPLQAVRVLSRGSAQSDYARARVRLARVVCRPNCPESDVHSVSLSHDGIRVSGTAPASLFSQLPAPSVTSMPPLRSRHVPQLVRTSAVRRAVKFWFDRPV